MATTPALVAQERCILPVTDDYPEGEGNKFSGKINWVRIDLEDDDVSHLEPEELKYRRMMARQ